jgi:4-hydroxythreonine-4-phosphate dehydrogenase
LEARPKEDLVSISQKPTVALTLGEPAGIGPELIAKLLARRDLIERAKVVLVGDAWLWEEAQAIAGVSIATRSVSGFEGLRSFADGAPLFLAVESVRQGEVPRSKASAAGGASVLQVLRMCMDAASAGLIDAICFAPLNKHSMILAGMKFSDDLHFFVDHLKVSTYCGELNTLGDLWTSRISSHVPFKDIGLYVTKPRIMDAVKLLYNALLSVGFEHPRVAVAALNPHGGEGGTCGREEIDIIAPALSELNAQGYPVAGRHYLSQGPRQAIRWHCRHVSRPGADRAQAARVRKRGDHSRRPADPDRDTGARLRLRHCGSEQGQCRGHSAGFPDRLPYGRVPWRQDRRCLSHEHVIRYSHCCPGDDLAIPRSRLMANQLSRI